MTGCRYWGIWLNVNGHALDWSLDQRLGYAYVAVIVLLVLFIVMILIGMRRVKMAEILIQEKNMELEAFNEELIASTDELNRQFEELVVKNQEIEFLAFHDPVTRLQKKDALMLKLKKIIEHKPDGKIAMYSIDILNLNTIVDTYGVPIEEPLLYRIAERLNYHFEDEHYLLGVYHDEFILVDKHTISINICKEQCAVIMEILKEPFAIDGREIDLKICIGYTVYPDISLSADELLLHSDMARMEAEKVGRDACRIYKERYLIQITNRLRMEKMLIKGIEEDQFSLYYQPKVHLETGRVIGFEALIRWHPETGQVVSPGVFIDTAEETGLIVEIGAWVLNRACAQLEAWNHQGRYYTVSVNVSTVQINEEDFVDQIQALLEHYDLMPNQLELEITETMIMHNIHAGKNRLEAIADLDVAISLDDFGTGYSSLDYIQQLPISKIKIDRSFTNELGSPKKKLVLNAMIQLGQSLGLQVNVEGVETVEQLDVLKQYQVDEVQGFYFSEPLSIEALETYLTHVDHQAIKEVVDVKK